MKDFQEVQLPFSVPYHSQVASPEMAAPIFNEGVDPIDDPRWRKTGAKTAQEYAYWVERSCGVVCVKMCIEAFGGEVHPIMYWIQKGLDRNGYIKLAENGELVEHGWLHQVLADLVISEGFFAKAISASSRDFVKFLEMGQLVIASVSPELGTTTAITRKGGHLVVVMGAIIHCGLLEGLIIHNPSGRTRELRAHAWIPIDRFEGAFTGRIIVASKNALD